VNAQGLLEMAYQMVGRNDPETLRFLNDDILLLVPVKQDGMELVSNWYMREPEPTKRTMGGLPRLYQKYVGHDNNRDSYIFNQPETENIARQMFIEWFPQIMYNQHQTGPAGTVLFAPPFRDPFTYNFDPLVPMGLELVAASMHNRFITEGKNSIERGSKDNWTLTPKRIAAVQAAIAKDEKPEAAGGVAGSREYFGFRRPIPLKYYDRAPDGTEKKLPSEKFFIPGSVLQASVDNTTPVAYGMGEKVDVFFDNSPVFHLDPDAALKRVRAVAWFPTAESLRSGWAWGQHYLQDGVAAVEATLGKGKVLLFGPEITFRGQPHGTFKLLFNGIYYAGATPVTLGAARKATN
jgi:hypothetical protein